MFLPVFHPTVCLLMPYEVRALGEGLATLITHVGALPSVGPLMPDEMGALAEGFSADLTLVRLGPRVSPQVLGDGRAIIESPPTLVTFKWPLSCVNSLMLCEGGALNECLSTVVTYVGLLSCVDFFMYRKVSRVLERFTTSTASANLAPLMNSCKCNLLGALAEGSCTAAAFPSFFSFAALLMTFYTGLVCHLFNS